jgi:protein SCO1
MRVPSRRDGLVCLAALAAGTCLAQPSVSAHDSFGPVRPPQALPPLSLVGDDGLRSDLATHLRGRTSALQLMFTGCSATCPIQGALFGAVAPLIAGKAEMQLLSITIDPLADGPQALRAWLVRFGATAQWRAAAPRVEDVDRLLELLRGRARGPDRHTAQVYLFDRRARLAYRTADMPPARFVADMLGELARLG